MINWRSRRGDFERCKDLIRNGETPPNDLTKSYEEFEAIEADLRKEFPILHRLVVEFMTLVTERLAWEQARWFHAWISNFKQVTARTDIPEWADIKAEFQHDFESTHAEEQIKGLGIIASAQARSINFPNERIPTAFQPESPADHNSRLFSRPDETALGSSEISNASQQLVPSAVNKDEDEPEPSNPKRNILWTAASLFEFKIETTKLEAGYPYLVYLAGEVCPKQDMTVTEYLLMNFEYRSSTSSPIRVSFGWL